MTIYKCGCLMEEILAQYKFYFKIKIIIYYYYY